MSLITVEEAKDHMELIGTAKDDYVQQCIDAAEAHAEQFMNRSLTTWEDDETTSDNNVPADVRQAILMLTSDFFENRTVGITGAAYTRNPAAERIMTMYRIGMGI